MDLDELSQALHGRFDDKMSARERALPAARRSIRASANAIRAIHRGERDRARELIGEAGAALSEGIEAVADHPDVRWNGPLQDAAKEFTEANVTDALIAEAPLPTPGALGVDDASFLNGVAEAIGEGRRHILDLLRAGDVERGARVLSELEDLHGMLATIDYPDAVTMNLRRSTDVARSLIEKTRGDLTIAFVQRDMAEALERHVERLRNQPDR